MMLKQYGDYIALFKDIPRIFMPIFWVEQRFIMNADTASQIKLALDIPCYGLIAGFVLLAIGVVLILVPYLKRLCCASKTSLDLPSKTESNGNCAVIKDREEKPLMYTTINLINK